MHYYNHLQAKDKNFMRPSNKHLNVEGVCVEGGGGGGAGKGHFPSCSKTSFSSLERDKEGVK